MLDLMLCCNDEHGHLDRLVAVEIAERDGNVLMALEGDVMDGDAFEVESNLFTVGGRVITARFEQEHVGSIRWDLWRTTPLWSSVLVNHLRTLPHWSCQEASSPLFEKWRSDASFTAADFESTEVPN